MLTRVELTTKIGCPCMCEYCAQDKILKTYKSNLTELTLENVKKYFRTIPKPTLVSIAGYSEPLRAKEIVDIVEWLIEDGRQVHIFSTLYLVEKSVIRKVLSKPNIFVRFHMVDIEGRTKIKLDDRLVQNYALANRILKANGTQFASCCWGTTPPELEPYISTLDHQTGIDTLTDFAGNVEGVSYLKPNHKLGKLTCNRCNYIHILPDGRVSMCAQDWSLKYILGDLNTDDYSEIFEREPYVTYRRNCDTYDEPTICRQCSDSKVVKEN